jgi:hypothetical protein
MAPTAAAIGRLLARARHDPPLHHRSRSSPSGAIAAAAEEAAYAVETPRGRNGRWRRRGEIASLLLGPPRGAFAVTTDCGAHLRVQALVIAVHHALFAAAATGPASK